MEEWVNLNSGDKKLGWQKTRAVDFTKTAIFRNS